MDKAKSKASYVLLYLYTYGAYGDSIEYTFSASQITLLDCGMIYAIVHIQGGAELGRQ